MLLLLISGLVFASPPLMDKLLRDIDSDVASIAQSRTSITSRTTSTVRGLGSLSGRAIMALGNVVVRGIDRALIQTRLRRIGEKVRQGVFLPPEIYEDLLELQRIGLYPSSVRYQAWDLLLISLEQRRTERIVDVILNWPAVEIQLLLRQLCIFKLSGWALHPARMKTIPAPSEATVRLQSTSRDDDLASSYRNVFGAVLKRNSQLVHELFTVDEFVLIQTNTSIGVDMPNGSWGPTDAAGSLDHFFDYLTTRHSSSHKKWELPLSASDFIDFLSTGARDQLMEVTVYILNTLRSFASSDAFPLHTLSILARYIKLPNNESVHPALSFLWFSLYLIAKSEDAAKSFRDSGFLDILEQMWLLDFPGSNRDVVRQDDVARRDMRVLICIILGVLSANGTITDLPIYLRTERTRFFLLLFSTFVSEYGEINAFRLPFFPGEPSDEQNEFYRVFLDYLSIPEGQDDQTAWDVLLSELKQSNELWLTKFLMEMPKPELQFILLRLVSFRASGRGFHSSQPLLVADPQTSPRHYSSRLGVLRSIVSKVHHEDPSLVHDVVNLNLLIILQSDENPSTGLSEDKALSSFFNELSLWTFGLYSPCELPERASVLLEYIWTAPPQQVRAVIDHIIVAIAGLLSGDTRLIKRVMGHYPNLVKQIHPVVPFLSFAIHLTLSSPLAANILLRNGFIEILIMSAPVPGMILTTDVAARIDTLHLLALGVLCVHDRHLVLQQLRGDGIQKLAESVIPTVLNVELCLKLGRSTWIDMSRHVQSILPPAFVQFVSPIPGDIEMHSHPWNRLVDTFRDHEGLTKDKAKATEQIFLFASSLHEDNWHPLTSVLSYFPSAMTTMYTYIIASYLGCPSITSGNRTASLTPETRSFLSRMVSVSQSRGFTIVHPVDRFMKLTSAATRGNDSVVKMLGMKNMLALVHAAGEGGYDLDVVPSGKQLADRQKDHDWMKFQIRIAMDNTYQN